MHPRVSYVEWELTVTLEISTVHPRVSYVEWELTVILETLTAHPRVSYVEQEVIAVLHKLAHSKSCARNPFEQPAILNHRNVYFLKNHYRKYIPLCC